MARFDEQRLDVNGVETQVLSAGEGEPIVFFHGAGTVTGFDALLPLAERHRLVVPIHPGFGGSADDESIDAIGDYVLHHLDVLDQLGIGELTLVGHSMGGRIAAWFAIHQAARVRRLVLAAPAGLPHEEHPMMDLFVVPDEEIFGYLSNDPAIFAPHLPDPPTIDFIVERYRESTSAARVMWQHPLDRKLPRWLHRLTMPTLVLWGEQDRLIPVGQAATWAGLVPGAEVRTLPGVGHLLFDETPEAAGVVLAFAAAGAVA
jgi:pimeloyl-ACP methyl ester carboxylesterase